MASPLKGRGQVTVDESACVTVVVLVAQLLSDHVRAVGGCHGAGGRTDEGVDMMSRGVDRDDIRPRFQGEGGRV
jgi:hypothetical protein